MENDQAAYAAPDDSVSTKGVQPTLKAAGDPPSSPEADTQTASLDDESQDFFDLSEPEASAGPVPPPYEEPEEIPVYKKPDEVREPDESWGEDDDDETEELRWAVVITSARPSLSPHPTPSARHGT